MSGASKAVQGFLLSHRADINAMVRARTFPGFPVDEAVAAALSWLEALEAAGLALETWPWEVALDLAEKGLLVRVGEQVRQTAGWIKRFPKAVAEGGRDTLVDWMHFLVKLSAYPQATSKVCSWLDSGLGKDWGRQEFRHAVTVLLWLAGGSPWRKAALEAYVQLKDSDRKNILAAAAPTWSEADVLALGADGLGKQPWARWCGGVTGLGGVWIAPPRVAPVEEKLYAWNLDRVWEISADAFGVELVPGTADPDTVGTLSMDIGPQRWEYQENKLKGPSGAFYPFPWGAPPDNIKGVELQSGLAAVFSPDMYSILVLYRGAQ